MKSIKNFVFLADKSFDNHITLEELFNYILEHKLHHFIPAEKAEMMFWDAARCRKIMCEKNRSDPLSELEIYAATRIQYRIDPKTKKTVAHPGKFRKEWISILNAVGEREPQQ